MITVRFRRRRNGLRSNDPASRGSWGLSSKSQGYWSHLSRGRCHQVSVRPIWLSRRAVSLPSGLGFQLPRRVGAWCWWDMGDEHPGGTLQGHPSPPLLGAGHPHVQSKAAKQKWEEKGRISSFPVSCCTVMCSG